MEHAVALVPASGTSDSAYIRARAKAVSAAALKRAKARARARAKARAETESRLIGERIAAANAIAAGNLAKAAQPPAPEPKPPTEQKLATASAARPVVAKVPPVKHLVPPSPKAVAVAAVAPPAVRPPNPEAPSAAPAPRKGVPKGFEQWFAPQKTAVDLYYGGRYLMTTLVEYTLDSITFLNPPEVAAHLPGLRSANELSTLLADAQPSHADQVCVRPNQPLCGRLEPGNIGVIFDETRFRADIFVHPSLLLEAQRQGVQYLPEPVHQSPTLVQNLGALYAGSSEGTNRFSLFGRTRIGDGRGHGFANWVSTDENTLSIDEAGYRHDFKDIQVSVGLFEPVVDALRAIPRQPIAGAGIARSLLTRTDLESVMASPIELFMPIRGRVDIFRDGRLISTGFYEAGNQSIDTSRLPGGAYNIEIIVTDVTGSTHTTRQLFIKSSLMAPPGEPLWFVDAGRVMQRAPLENLPTDYGASQLRAGYRWRQKPWLGLGTAAALTENESLVELSAGLLFDKLEGGAEIYASSGGGSGFGLRGLTRWKELVASANFQQTTADDPIQTPEQFRLLPFDQALSSIQLSYPLWNGLLTASLSQRLDPPDADRIQRSTIAFTRTFPLGGYHSLQVQAEAGAEDGKSLAMLSLQWRNTRGKWLDTAQVRVNQNSSVANSNNLTTAVGTTWHDGDRFVDDVEFGIRGEAGNQNQSVTLDGQHRSQFGRGSASLTASSINGYSRNLTSLGYETSLVVGEHGAMAIGGGPNLNEAGILLDLRNAPDARFEVSSDGQYQFIARGGRTAALTLPPYHQYRIRLKDSGLALAQFDDHPHEVTLYPGHVVSPEWGLQSLQVLITRIVRADGTPLANARIEGAEGPAFTDEDGYIQTEISSSSKELLARAPGSECRIRLPAAASGKTIIRAEELSCIESGETSTPEAGPVTAPQP